MKFSRTSGLLALGLAGSVLADGSYETVTGAAKGSWDSASSVAGTTTVTTTTCLATVTVAPASCATTTVTVDKNGKPFPPASSTDAWGSASAVAVTNTKTVSYATVFVGPGFCATTTVTVDGKSKPFPPASTTGSSATGNWNQPAASVTGAPAGSMDSGDGSWNDVSTIGDNGDVWKWTAAVTTVTASGAAPTYTGHQGNSTLPTPGSQGSNVTQAQGPLPEGSCNSGADRSKWCGNQDINVDAAVAGYSTGKICSYDFTITNTTIDFDGTGAKMAFAINGQVPGPLIECNWGDTLQVTVHNKLQANSTTIHWHGILQKGTNDQDGVPGVTECAIAPGSSRTYTMALEQYGTGWYHSHALAQYADGIRGPMIIHGPATANYDLDMGTVMIDDTFPVSAQQQNERIAHTGPTGTVNYLLNGHNTSPDLKTGQHALWTVSSGKKHLFRLVNSAAQNMFSVHFDNHKMQVIAVDYVPIKPYYTEWLNIGIGQRYDVIVEMNQPAAGYFLRAVTQTGCPSGSANNGLGAANGIFLYEGAQPYLPTSTAGGKTAADFNFCLDEPIASLVPWVAKRAGTSSAFQASVSTIPAGSVAQVQTTNDGTVFRWFINNGAINVNYTQPTLQTIGQGGNQSSISNPITLNNAGQWYYFVIQNQFFASHPMHLHGHDMSVLGQGTVAWDPSLVSTLNFVNPIRRDTAMLTGSSGPGAPPGYTVIGFEADNPGAWLMHCHIIWHVDGGLALQWVERPSEISKYSASSAFQNECSSLNTWQNVDLSVRTHGQGSSGLKARSFTFMDEQLSKRSSDVVRRTAGKQLLDAHAKRGLGDGFRSRHVRK